MAIKNYGTEQRTKPRLIVLRGWDPHNPAMRHVSAPVASGATIKSGQLIGLRNNASVKEFDLSLAAAGDVAFFAMQDSDDFDVVASGVLTGLNSADQCEIQTPYYSATFVLGDNVTYDVAVPGSVIKASGNAAGALCGKVSVIGGTVDIKPINSEATPDGSGQVLVLQFWTNHQQLGDVTP